MKRLLCFLFAAFAVFVIPLALFGQGDTELPPLPITFDFSQYVSTFLMYAATVVMLTSIVNKFLKLKGFVKQYLSWGIALIIGFVAYFLNYGIFDPIKWYQVLIYAILTGLGSNGLFDWQLIQKILQAIGLEAKKPPTPIT